jgi:soluble cytochrome b562
MIKVPGDLVGLAEELRAKAREHGDEAAIAAAEKAHEHAASGNLENVRRHAEELSTIATLMPYAKALLDALANVGI